MNPYLEMDFGYLVEGLTGAKMVPVSNLGRKRVAYSLPELHVEREWRQFEVGRLPDKKNIPFGELYALWNAPGGQQLVWDNLMIDDDQAREALGLPLSETTPEVEYTREDVRRVLTKGTEDEVLDMIEFGPYYIAEWIKEESVNIDSSSRREFLGKVFHIDINNLEANLEWAASDADAGRLQYGSIQGVDNAQESGERQRRARRKKAATKTEKSTGPNRRVAKK